MNPLDNGASRVHVTTRPTARAAAVASSGMRSRGCSRPPSRGSIFAAYRQPDLILDLAGMRLCLQSPLAAPVALNRASRLVQKILELAPIALGRAARRVRDGLRARGLLLVAASSRAARCSRPFRDTAPPPRVPSRAARPTSSTSTVHVNACLRTLTRIARANAVRRLDALAVDAHLAGVDRRAARLRVR